MPDGATATEEKKITLSESASRRINELAAAEGKVGMMMRVTVNGGGCSGFTYSFDMDNKTNDDDLIFERNGAKVVIDDMSIGFLLDAELDYVEDLMGSYFSFKNPNAASTCGCGSSFSI
ncbi:MAG: iron-sulfur cluster insertion protein ErpA [Rhodospirillales bacterium]|jgi:iron-sulfur cluster insertion protein